MAETSEGKNPLGIDWLKTLAGALAAVTSALLLSTLGAAGTIIGAALGSLAATIGTAVYSQALAKSKESVVKAQQVTLGKVGVAQAEVRRASRSDDAEAVETHLDAADAWLDEARADAASTDPGADSATPTLKERLAGLPWKRIVITALVVFAVALSAITAFELVTGRSVGSRLGGGDEGRTTIGSVTTDDKDSGQDRKEPSRAPSEPASSPTPSEEASPSDEASSEPAETESPTPSQTPTQSAEPTETPTPGQNELAPTDPTTAPTPAETPSP